MAHGPNLAEWLFVAVTKTEKRLHTDFSGTGNQPANHLSPSPVQRGQSHPHHLQTHRQRNMFTTLTQWSGGGRTNKD